MKVLAFFFAACIIGGAIAQDIVIFGDSLSDNGNGYAANAKLVLQTDEVRISHSKTIFLFLLFTISFTLCAIDPDEPSEQPL